jgi:CRP-like cAMP-binding protein
MAMRTQMTTSDRSEVLRSLPIFAGCSDKDLHRIAGIVHEVFVDEGDSLVRENEPAAMSYVIVSGDATVSAQGVVINELHAGDLCGEMAILDDEPRCATVTARSPLRALGIPSKDFAALVEQPWMTRRVLRTIVERLRSAEGAASY